MQVPVHNLTGEVVSQIEVSDYVFGVPSNEAVVHQVMLSQLAGARQGNASAKTRGEVSGSTKKLYRQKGTGNARAGSIKSPLRRGGGVIFPPTPRSYRQTVPVKMRRLALRSLLSAKARDEELIVLENLTLAEPSTKNMAQILTALGVESSTLVVSSQVEENVIKSARNLPGVKTAPVNILNVVDLLNHKTLVITVDGVRKAEELWGKKPSDGGSNAPVRGAAPSANN